MAKAIKRPDGRPKKLLPFKTPVYLMQQQMPALAA